MQAPLPSATAVFSDREEMEIAVRSLTERGIRPQSISVSHGSTIEPIRTSRWTTLILGIAIGVGSGGSMMLVWIYWLSSLGSLPLDAVLVKTVHGAMTGGFAGIVLTLLALLEHRVFRSDAPADEADFVVTVKPPNEAEAREICALLALRGGDLVADPSTSESPYRYRHLFGR
jgi:hypothetical protein